LWYKGLCVPETSVQPLYKNIIFVASGTILPLLLGILFFYSSFYFDLSGIIKFISVIFLCWAAIDFLNLFAASREIKMADGRITNNDGNIIWNAIKNRKHNHFYHSALQSFNKGDFAEAAKQFAQLTEKQTNAAYFRGAIVSYIQARDFNSAEKMNSRFEKISQFDENDYCNAGVIQSWLNRNELSLDYYKKSLSINPDHTYSLVNMGYALNTLGNYEEAFPYFDKVISIDPSFAYAYNNRGLAKIKTGKAEEGLEDINHSLTLDNTNAYAYRNLGIYHLEKQNYEEALKLFEKSREIDATTPQLDDLMTEAKSKQVENQA